MIDQLVRKERELASAPKIVAIIQYGNPAGADKDVLAVLAKPIILPEYQAAGRGVDLSFISRCQLEEQLDWADPAMTEPVLTGWLIQGNRSSFEWWRAGLKDREVGNRDCRLMESRADSQLAIAKSWFGVIDRLGQQSRLNALCALSFAVSYRLFAGHYRRRPHGVITFAELRRQGNAVMEQTLAVFKQAKAGQVLAPPAIAAQIAAAEGFIFGSD